MGVREECPYEGNLEKVLTDAVKTVIYIHGDTMKNIDTVKDKQFRELLLDVKKEIIKIFGVRLKQLILYGSYARNQHDPESDIDIIILVDD